MKTVKILTAEEIETAFKACVALTAVAEPYSEATKKEFVQALAERCNEKGIPLEAALYHIQNDYNYDDAAVRSVVQTTYSKPPDNEKKPERGHSNIDVIEKHLHTKYNFRYNQVTSRLEMKEVSEKKFEPMSDFMVNSTLRDLLKSNIKCGVNTLRNILNSNFCPVFNPFEDYFFNLPAFPIESGGQQDYIDQMADTVTTTNQEFWKKCFKKWMVALVASAVEPAVINHTVIVLSGRQGCGKTTWCENLVPPSLKSYLFSGTINPNNKDTLIHLSECLLINLDELENLNRTEIGSLKEIITKTSVRIRRAYGYNNEFIPRRASFIASVNISQFLNDTTGSRRFLPFEVTEIQYRHTVPLDLVYSQALHLYKSGFQFWFSKSEIEELAANNEKFQVRTAEEELLLTYFEPADEHHAPLYLTATHIVKLLNDHAKISVKTSNVITIGKALKKNGFCRIKKGGVWVYPVKMFDFNQVEYNNTQPPQKDESPELPF